tara:strand:- start:1165 stop:1512 length:348 start_codon:yes stop_codon:yes gene_type:complete
MDGDWSLNTVKVTDGQLTEHILEDINGNLNLNFAEGKSDGAVYFDLNINMVLYSFSVEFQGDDLRFNVNSNNLLMGSGDDRMNYTLILLTKKDLVLEYYDFPTFQLRKFVFVKEE